MLHICMAKEDNVLKEIELLLEEKFSKIGMYYEVAELQLNDGSKKKVFSTYLLQELMLILNWL